MPGISQDLGEGGEQSTGVALALHTQPSRAWFWPILTSSNLIMLKFLYDKSVLWTRSHILRNETKGETETSQDPKSVVAVPHFSREKIKQLFFLRYCFHFAMTFHICSGCRCWRWQERRLTPWHGDMFQRKKDTSAALPCPACHGCPPGRWLMPVRRGKRVNLVQHWKLRK